MYEALVSELKVGDIIFDGIWSRVQNIVKYDDYHYITVLDGNGYINYLRLDPKYHVMITEDISWEDYFEDISMQDMKMS